jgi:hypothetical protein
MNNAWKWILGIALVIMTLLALQFVFLPYAGYGMMNNGYYAWRMPMMYGGYGIMGFGMMLFMRLIPTGLLVLLGLGIVRLVKALTARKQ